MRAGTLTYDGTTYRLDAEAVADLLSRGVIRADPMFGDQFELASDHVIAEVEQFADFAAFLAGDDARGESASGDDNRGHVAVRLHQRNGFGGFR